MLSRFLCASLALLVTQAGAIGHYPQNDAVLHSRAHYVEDFQKWMSEYEVTFKTRGEYERRLQIFIHNSDLIEMHNAANAASYTLAHNEFSHLSWHEFKATHLGYRRPARAPRMPKVLPEVGASVSRRRIVTVPDEVDWAADGAVTPVQNQGMCGSCWAFSAIGAMEGAYFVETGELMKFSEEQLVDCDTVDQGCNGGDMGQAFDWIKQNGGVCDEDDYPYEGMWPPFKTCRQTCSAIEGTEVEEWKQVDATDAALMAALAEVGPIAIAIEADQMTFQFYRSGVLTSPCGSNLDHGVLLVGYGTAEDGTNYWKVKNSWGESWGMDGYILLERSDGEESEGGECGILLEAVYPVLGTSEESPRMELPVVVRDPDFQSSASAEDCGGGQTEAAFNSLVITPSSPARGQPIAMQADGILTQPVQSTSYELSVSLGDSQIFDHTGSLCGDSEAELPIGMGTVEIHGMQCPATPGPVSISFSLTMPVFAPPGEYGINLSAVDSNSASLLCIDVDLNM